MIQRILKMKKFMKAAAVLLSISMLMTGCGKSAADESESQAPVENQTSAAEQNESVVLSRGEYTASDFCTMKDYSVIKILESEIAVTEDEIQEEVNNIMTQYEELTEFPEEHKVEEGDIVNIDYSGYLDGEAFEGGTAEGTDLEIGSGSFIDGFEDGLIGAVKGQKLELPLTFPDPYPNNPDLAGKEVIFKVTVNKVQQYVLPDYTDEFVKENLNYETIKEYEASLEEALRENKKQSVFAEKLFALAEFSETFPESLENFYVQSYASMLTSSYGVDVEEFAKSKEMTVKEVIFEELGMKETIENSMKADLILGVIAEQEKILAEGEAYESFLEEMIESYQTDRETLFKNFGEEELKMNYELNNAYEHVFANIVIE